MEIIALDSELKEKYPLLVDIDFEIGDASASNDFEVIMENTEEYALYIPDTEFGGILEYDDSVSNSKEITMRGFTWRGLLTQWIISPSTGNDYKIVSGEAHEIMRELLGNVLGGFFVVPDTDSGLTIEEYQFKLHCTVLEGLMAMLSDYGYKLKIYAKRTKPGESVSVYCEAVPNKKIEGTYDEDTRLSLHFTNDQMGINHLICLGSGQLRERQRLDLYLDSDGNIGEEQYYTGLQERQAVYDYGNAESLEDLRKNGTEKLKESAMSKKLQINEVTETGLDIGDIVVGRKNEINLVVEQPIVRKIFRISDGKEMIEYKVKGEG